jgi:hypothetical protein
MIDGKELYDLSSDPGAESNPASVFWVHFPMMKSNHHAKTDSHDKPNRTNLNQKDVAFAGQREDIAESASPQLIAELRQAYEEWWELVSYA